MVVMWCISTPIIREPGLRQLSSSVRHKVYRETEHYNHVAVDSSNLVEVTLVRSETKAMLVSCPGDRH